MTKREKIEKLAEVVGLHKHRRNKGGYCWLSDSSVPQHYSEWHPYKNIQDAWMIVERVIQLECPGFNVSYDGLGWFAEFIVDGGHKSLFAEGKTAQEAICEAVLND